MDIKDVKEKLEFEKIINRIKSFSYSDLGIEKCDLIDFIVDKRDLEEELDKVIEMKEVLNLSGSLELTGLKDIREILEKVKIEGNYISSDKLLWVLDFLKISRRLKEHLRNINEDNSDRFELLSKLVEPLYYDKILEHNIEITIDETGEVKDSASVELRKIRKEILSKSESLRKSLAKILKNVSEKEFSQDDIITLRDGRSVIPVKVENKRKVPGIVHSSSGSGATVFIEPGETIELNNDITELQFKEKREIEKILIELSSQIAYNYEVLKLNCSILAEIDFLQAKARYAVEIIALKPVITDSEIELRKAFHPILVKNHGRKNVEPLNLIIGNEFNTLVVTGPNAGGKTVALKTVGIVQLMFQSAILPSVDPDSKMRVFNQIFVNVGDDQSIESDLSTFSSHLKSIKEVLDNADNKSLVLIDEICSGTDPTLGSALSSAVLRLLSSKDCVSIVTTHIGDLKSFAYNTEGIENASLEFDTETLSPNFKFVIGIPGQSFTFEIARKYDFPEDVLSYSESLLDENENNLENLIKDLNENKQKYEELNKKYNVQNARLDGLIKIYDEKVSELKENEKSVIKKAKQDAEQILKDANKLIEKTIKEIRERKDFSPKVVKEEFQKETSKLTDYPKEKIEEKVIEGQLEINDAVRLKGSNTTGELIEIHGKSAAINANGIIIRTKLSDLEKISTKEIKKTYSSSSRFTVNTESVETRLDLRGMYSDEVRDVLEKFIFDAHINGLGEVTIVHGKGSGKLRKEVTNQLKDNSIVKSFRLGNWNEGDTGVTIVEF